ncbi:hypothetical protein QF205_13195 [Luteimonas composti]|uniref:Lectin n=1 Tax=Luteimonas composti TaxID=398257 RepID=A0ABT6MUT3_9GAMM|nr:hypothetical protein [Luteimonas composti]MDH7454016.1 hypothetical protein [Luteimonas composti]
MHLLQPALLAVLATALCACGAPRDGTDADAADVAPPAAQAPPSSNRDAASAPVQGDGQATGSLRVDRPADGTIGFAGFGPAAFGASAEAVRQAWGGDLGDAQPSEPGGCHYLIPQPLGPGGYRTAFMIEGDRFVRIDVRDADVAAPGGARVGMDVGQVRALYDGRIEEQPHKYDPDGRVLRVTAPDGAPGVLVLELDGSGRVDEWRVGLPPQVDYVEGCS